MKLSLSMWSVVSAVKTGAMDLMGFIDFAAEQGVAGVELLDVFWSDAKAGDTAGEGSDDRCRSGDGGVFDQQQLYPT